MIRLGFLLPLLLPVLVVAGAGVGGFGNLLVPAVIFALVPIMDALAGEDRRNPVEPVRGRFFDFVLYGYVPVQFCLLVWAAGMAARISNLELLGLSLSVGIVTGGIGITVAHELGHRRSRVERALAVALLSCVSYVHFLVEHNKGHHSRVATPDDPATARFGESFYRFLPRTLVGSLRSALRIERKRVRREGRPAWSWRNRMYIAVIGPLLACTAMILVGGPAAAVLFLVQSAVAIGLLEAVNYIEHYGLERARHADGTYAKVDIQHSWNASFAITNYLLFNLQRHSHHHVHQSLHYQQLHDLRESPQLPAGYASLVPLALLPPVWHKVMGPRVRRYRALHGMDRKETGI